MKLDLTTGHPLKQVLKFAVPVLISNFFQLLYSMIDMVIVGRTLGEKSLAAVGLCGAPIYLILGFFWGLTGGVSTITSQRVGAKDDYGVRHSIATGFVINTAISLAVTVPLILLCRRMLIWINTPLDIINECYEYLIWIIIGIVTTAWSCFTCATMRALGDSNTPFVAIVLSTICNILLDLLFICVFHWGVAGAAIATQIAHFVCAGWCVWYGYRHYPQIRIRKSDWHFNFSFHMVHYKVGLPMAFQHSIIGIGLVVMQFVINGFGSTAVAGVAISGRIEQISTLPMFAVGLALATFGGQNYGAKDLSRIALCVKQAVVFYAILSSCMCLLMLTTYPFFSKIFFAHPSSSILEYVKIYIWTNTTFFFALSMICLFRFLLQGIGYAYVALFASVAELIMRSAGAPLFAYFYGFTGACLANPLAWIASDIILIPFYFYAMKKLHEKFSKNNKQKNMRCCNESDKPTMA